MAPKRSEVKNEEEKRQEALDFLVETIKGLISELGSDEMIWGSMLKSTMQHPNPNNKIGTL